MVGSILSGVTERKDFRSFINIHSEFGEEAVAQVISLLSRPGGLEELRIINCECLPLSIGKLVTAI